ncbi:hypothetical protein IHQ71_30010 (plasmid) [Rhizobium sp. TH2]|uniref:hypothetical protein n=1 Tax=Rhizobium sp. TH2 TaxID=2775403 RepID=UPI0021585782|nr:hypothetical protein [Rhizobium sp. TH2]UVC12484.1 hypothetical protein IHQ71_30010 [Rhizobium sp. TH2]
MAKTPIGEPIPVGNLPSPIEDKQPASMTADGLPSLRENTQPEPRPADNLPSLAEDVQSALPVSEATSVSGSSDLMQMSWHLALLPAMTWSSFFNASWKAWESAAQPQWPAR